MEVTGKENKAIQRNTDIYLIPEFLLIAEIYFVIDAEMTKLDLTKVWDDSE